MTAEQKLAANPEHSVWVAASAGTGKTKVLTDRVLRLLLLGTAPEKILCLTFTKAASAEMANRINAELAKWAIMEESQLVHTLEGLTASTVDETLLIRARCLFAQVLEAADGPRIQTIHAFCQTLIKRFPLEAGVPPHFQLLDEQTSRELLQEAQSKWMMHLNDPENEAASVALERIAGRLSDGSFHDLLQEVLGKRGMFESLFDQYGLDELIQEIYSRLGVSVNDSRETLLRRFAELEPVRKQRLFSCAEVLSKASASYANAVPIIQAWLHASSTERISLWQEYCLVYLTKSDLSPRAKLINAPLAKKHPEIEEALIKEQQDILNVLDELNSLHIASSTADLLIITQQILSLYKNEKEKMAGLDYDDLVLITEKLLHQSAIAPWVLYKLDGGVDHLLVDEAQDTSPIQWRVIEALSEEFFSGESAQNHNRTLFVVGDEKQSIYSFQGADPKVFNMMQQLFAEKTSQAQKGWQSVMLQTSFRSTVPVLRCVDHIFSDPILKRAVTDQETAISHEAFRSSHSGLVELWPLEEKEEQEEIEPWSLPKERVELHDPEQFLSDKIATTIAHWIKIKRPLSSGKGAVQPGDIMILVRKRTQLVEKIIRALKKHQVPVAGMDRMRLTDHIAVEDLLALGEFLLLPDDDLNLACVLKSPFIGLSEEDLFSLCYDRGQKTLWQCLKEKQQDSEIFQSTYLYLKELLAKTDFLTPFELYYHVLEVKSGKKQLARRLGEEVYDPVDEFLNFALAYEQSHIPMLQGFIQWIRGGGAEVKRDLEQTANQVRVMTVHGSKGLQAPIVFLPDTTSTPTSRATLLWDKSNVPVLPLWLSRAAYANQLCKEIKQGNKSAEYEEYIRLLYVALTRAEDELYIGGCLNNSSLKEGCWYDLVQQAMQKIGEKKEDGSVSLYQQGEFSGDVSTKNHGLETEEIVIPDYVMEPAPKEQVVSKPLTPSRLESEEPAVETLQSRQAMLKGSAVHTLLQYLPDVPSGEREEIAVRYLAKYASDLPEAEQQSIISSVLAIMDDPVFSSVFGKNSLAEVPITGVVDGAVVSGQIDRLVEQDNHVLIIDYKTNRRPPENVEDVSISYKRQMVLYRMLVERIFPGKPVRMAIIWTETGALMELT